MYTIIPLHPWGIRIVGPLSDVLSHSVEVIAIVSEMHDEDYWNRQLKACTRDKTRAFSNWVPRDAAPRAFGHDLHLFW